LQTTPSPFRGARQANSDTPPDPSFESPPDVPTFPATSPAAAAYLDASPTTSLASFPSADVSAAGGGPDMTSSPVWTPDLNATTADMRWSLFEDDSYGADRRPSPRLAALLLPAHPSVAAANSTTVAPPPVANSTVAGRVYGDPDLDRHMLNMELDLQSLFGLLCTVVQYSLAETTVAGRVNGDPDL
jgi:hypothetical protein